ncbi:hypothetical protein [Streptomyces olivochromogenes]|uniref:Uncharacterized protein n=1 Tax=Streptomyces olivochromogenes TaxID=1963 RepID=A0A250VB74_STROL|nr:hypothetical protein [Streptomyces olivochromogenes]KUN46513.1 hypothetical protein AQJ27_17625 [Streptomyces olivochromogenes]GAX51428.1 hypothetical protein SO3561_02930 [Streptomyces olivochromogenes]
MSGLFDGLGRLDLDAHARRWSAAGTDDAHGGVSQWVAAAQQFAARIQADPAGVSDEQWRSIAEAWTALLAAAERATGTQRNEWLLRDLWLRSWLVQEVGPRADVPLFDPGPVLERALDAMPMSPEEAAELAPRWRELAHAQMRALRMIRLLLAPVHALARLLADHPRWREFEAYQRLAGELP